MNRRFIVVITLAAACGKKDDGAENAKSGKPAATIDVAGINALVPATLQDELVFEQREVVTDHTGGGSGPKVRFTVAVPKSWERKPYGIVDDFAALGPPASSKLDGSIQFSLKSACKQDGICLVQDSKAWAELADKEVFATYRRDGIVFERDEVRPNDRLAILRSDSARYVVYVWWQDGGKRYRICWTKLSGAVQVAAQAFEKSCRAVAVAGE